MASDPRELEEPLLLGGLSFGKGLEHLKPPMVGK